MQVVVLFCSPHPRGRTQALLSEYLGKLPPDVSVRRFDAYRMQARPCIDCGRCAREDGCALPDLEEFFASLEQSDLFVLASPVYFLSFPAPAKAVIDRMQRYFARRFFRGVRPAIAKPRRAAVLLSYESEQYGGCEMIRRQAEMLLSLLHVTETEFIARRATPAGAAGETPPDGC